MIEVIGSWYDIVDRHPEHKRASIGEYQRLHQFIQVYPEPDKKSKTYKAEWNANLILFKHIYVPRRMYMFAKKGDW